MAVTKSNFDKEPEGEILTNISPKFREPQPVTPEPLYPTFNQKSAFLSKRNPDTDKKHLNGLSTEKDSELIVSTIQNSLRSRTSELIDNVVSSKSAVIERLSKELLIEEKNSPMFYEVVDKRSGLGLLIVWDFKRRQVRYYKVDPNQNKLLKVIKLSKEVI